MTCYAPKKIYLYGGSNKKVVKFSDYGDVYITKNGEVFPFINSVNIPCGVCVGCQSDRAKARATRLTFEQQTANNSYMLTLTYDDNYCPNTLVKEHLQTFIKSLRTNCSRHGYENLRYYAVGEYGSKSYRPHYHLILFNIRDDDFKQIAVGNNIAYDSDYLNNLRPYGFIQINVANEKTISYVARYVNKKQCRPKEEKSLFNNLGLLPEFNIMSLKPGLGYQFIINNLDYILKNNYKIQIGNKNYSIPPHYFKKILEKNNIDTTDYDLYNNNIGVIVSHQIVQDNKDCSNYDEVLKKLEKVKKDTYKLLKRKGVN